MPIQASCHDLAEFFDLGLFRAGVVQHHDAAVLQGVEPALHRDVAVFTVPGPETAVGATAER